MYDSLTSDNFLMGDKISGTQKIDETQLLSQPFTHMCLTMINVTELDEIRLSQLIFAKTEEAIDLNKIYLIH